MELLLILPSGEITQRFKDIKQFSEFTQDRFELRFGGPYNDGIWVVDIESRKCVGVLIDEHTYQLVRTDWKGD